MYLQTICTWVSKKGKKKIYLFFVNISFYMYTNLKVFFWIAQSENALRL